MIANNVYQTDEKYQEEDMLILCIVVLLVWNVGVMEFMSILRHWFITICISCYVGVSIRYWWEFLVTGKVANWEMKKNGTEHHTL